VFRGLVDRTAGGGCSQCQGRLLRAHSHTFHHLLLQVSGIIAPLLLQELDACQQVIVRRERELEKERKRGQRHVLEASRNRDQYHRLVHVAQDSASAAAAGTASPLKLSFRDTLPSLAEEDMQVMGPSVARNTQSLRQRTPSTMSRPTSAGDGHGGRSVPPSPRVVAGSLDGSGRWQGRMLTTHVSSSSQDDWVFSPGEAEAGRPASAMSRQASSSQRSSSSRGGRSVAGGKSSGSIAIAAGKVRQIADPASQLLNQLHKIIFVTQLPPDPTPNVARHVIELYVGPSLSIANISCPCRHCRFR